jgi:RNA polymerase sigma-70 factor (ECF subfamily)
MGPVGDRARWSDAELLSAVAGRDREAFSVFYRRHLSETIAYLLSQTRDREVAADLTAEVLPCGAGRSRSWPMDARPSALAAASSGSDRDPC